jgi:hypothetical protein
MYLCIRKPIFKTLNSCDMKKTLLILAAISLTFLTAKSQAPGDVFGKGSSAINLGIGIGNTVYTGAFYKIGFPTISASYELGIVEVPMGSSFKGVVSAGGLVGFGGSKYDYSYFLSGYGYSVRTTYFIVAARGNYHFIFHDQFDPYAGILLGYYFGSHKVDYDAGYAANLPRYSGKTGGFHGGAYVGARWFFTPAFAAFAELGWNVSIFTIGATLKF